MIETCAVIGKNGDVLLWHEPAKRTGGSIPDSFDLWVFLLENKDKIQGVAHSHPGSGRAWPSYEDVTTFSAVERGLGCKLDWWIVTENTLMLLRSENWKKGFERLEDVTPRSWLNELRRLSGYYEEKENG